jgi:hypothetical protein
MVGSVYLRAQEDHGERRRKASAFVRYDNILPSLQSLNISVDLKNYFFIVGFLMFSFSTRFRYAEAARLVSAAEYPSRRCLHRMEGSVVESVISTLYVIIGWT